ncbi:uncharacterized protein LOC129755734 isoform X1 [Uranotaenia lowii]|uniref:uncharacterized protein LOC129755734 isoform X1 n=1 Tax=Uranotaenia lowii TaxID=190385 RepID=UPI00247A8FAB|nr:uncharacterized protein LOC129755734 isoform X1 [Uranotaenia lowii]
MLDEAVPEDPLKPTERTLRLLIGKLKLLPLVESCEKVWPSRLDFEAILPSYQENLLELRSLLLPEMVDDDDNEVEKLFELAGDIGCRAKSLRELQISIIMSCFESTAFVLSDELGQMQQDLRQRYVWDKVLLKPAGDGQNILKQLIATYKANLLREDWFYYYGDLSGFCQFVWDLMELGDKSFIDRDTIELVQQICLKMIDSETIQLALKGISLLEECIYKTREKGFINYEKVYERLFDQTWRIFETDERDQQFSIILMSALLECVKVLEVDRNQLMSTIQNFGTWSKADSLMNLLVGAVERSKDPKNSLALFDHIVLLLNIGHSTFKIIPFKTTKEDKTTDSNPYIESNGSEKACNQLVIYDSGNVLSFSNKNWWETIMKLNHNRFHRWTVRLLETIIAQVERFDFPNPLFHQVSSRTEHSFNGFIKILIFFQYLCGILFSIIDCPGLNFKGGSEQCFDTVVQLMMSFLEKLASYLDRLLLKKDIQKADDESVDDHQQSVQRCVEFFEAAFALVKHFIGNIIESNPELIEAMQKGGSMSTHFQETDFLKQFQLLIEQSKAPTEKQLEKGL